VALPAGRGDNTYIVYSIEHSTTAMHCLEVDICVCVCYESPSGLYTLSSIVGTPLSELTAIRAFARLRRLSATLLPR
jgi:hypothetical protein